MFFFKWVNKSNLDDGAGGRLRRVASAHAIRVVSGHPDGGLAHENSILGTYFSIAACNRD